MNGIIRLAVLLTLLVGAFITLGGESAEGRTIFVDDDAPEDGNGSLDKPFRTITDAMMVCGDGDTVRVFEGTYEEFVTIERSIILIGNASIDADLSGGSGILVQAHGVTIERLLAGSIGIQGNNVSVINCRIVSNGGGGIYIGDSIGVVIESVRCDVDDEGIRVERSDDVSIRNVTISSAETGVKVTNSANVTIENAMIRRCKRGITATGMDTSTIQGNTIEKSEWEGMWVWGTEIHILDNIIRENDDEGITGRGLINCTIKGNTFTGNDREGIALENSWNSAVEDNSFLDNRDGGLYMATCGNISVVGNAFTGMDPVLCMDSVNCLFSGNSMDAEGFRIRFTEEEHFTSHAIDDTNLVNGRPIRYLANESDAAFTAADPRFSPENCSQVIIAGCSNLSFTGLDISDVDTGIQIGYSGNITITGCTILNCTYGISDSWGSGTMIRDSRTMGCGWGIEMSETDRPVIIGNELSGNGSRDVHFEGVTEGRIDSNRFRGTSTYACFLSGSDSCVITSNVIDGTHSYGVYLYYGESNRIIGNVLDGTRIVTGISLFNEEDDMVDGNDAIECLVGIRLAYNVENCDILNNEITLCRTGIQFSNPGRGNVIHFNSIWNNLEYGISGYVDPDDEWLLDARNNWWGDVSGPFHPQRNPCGKGNMVEGDVEFCDWTGLDSCGVTKLSGYVRDSKGNLIPHAKVEIYDTRSFSGSTTEEGFYEIVNIPISACPWRVTVTKHQYEPFTTYMDIRDRLNRNFTRYEGVNTIYVDDDSPPSPLPEDGTGHRPYTRIRYAVENATSGTTIRVFHGTYNENFTIPISVQLIGNGSEDTIIDGYVGHGMPPSTILITADMVHVAGFTITNFSKGITVRSNDTTITMCTLTGNGRGIQFESSSNCTVRDCEITWNGRGIDLVSSHENVITENVFENNWGSRSHTGFALHLIESHDNDISSNFFTKNGDAIDLEFSNNTAIRSNELIGNFHNGIYVVQSPGTTIDANAIRDHPAYIYGDSIHLSLSDHSGIWNNDIESNEYGLEITNSHFLSIRRNSVLENEIGFWLWNVSNSTIEENEISGNGIGMWLRGGCSGNRILENMFSVNIASGMNATANDGIMVDARFNSWGDPSGPWHPSENQYGGGDNVTDLVWFDPWSELVAMREHVVLSGHIWDQEGNPIPSASLRLTCVMDFHVNTDQEGGFMFTDIPVVNCTWLLTISRWGFEEKSMLLQINEAQVIEITLTPIAEKEDVPEDGDGEDDHRFVLSFFLLLLIVLTVILWSVVTGRIPGIGPKGRSGTGFGAGSQANNFERIDDGGGEVWDESDTKKVTEQSHRCMDCENVFDMDELHRPIRPACPRCNGFRIEKLFK